MTQLQLLTLFNHCMKGPWVTIGLDIQYKVEDGILYLQGSVSDMDWKTNFDFPVVPYKKMRELFFIHRGFLKAWKSIREEIRALDFHTIIGYSHGADIALPIHEDFLYRKGYQPTTIVFGCSKILFLPGRRIKNRFSNVLNVQSRGDIFTYLVPGYTRVGKVLTLKGKIHRPEGFSRLIWLSRHAPETYRQRLQGE